MVMPAPPTWKMKHVTVQAIESIVSPHLANITKQVAKFHDVAHEQFYNWIGRYNFEGNNEWIQEVTAQQEKNWITN